MIWSGGLIARHELKNPLCIRVTMTLSSSEENRKSLQEIGGNSQATRTFNMTINDR